MVWVSKGGGGGGGRTDSQQPLATWAAVVVDRTQP